MNLQRNLRWQLIIPLAVLALIRPLLSILGVYRNLPGISGPILATAFIAIIWVIAVLTRKIPNPIITLAATGGLYGCLVPVLQQLTWYFAESPAISPPPIAFLNIILTETIWGAIVGLAAIGIRHLLSRHDSTT